MGAGLAVMAVGGLSAAVGAESMKGEEKASNPEKSKESLAQPFVLPLLPFAFDALEPYVDAQTMEIHYTAHHQAYIDKANRALAEYPELLKLTANELLKDLRVAPESIRGVLRNNVGGHANHSLFWSHLSPKPEHQPGAALGKALEASFGSLDAFKQRLEETAMRRFGSGWAWLSLSPKGALVLHSTANQDSPVLFGLTPLMGIDVWEHAYYLKHQNQRLNYVRDIMQVIDWSVVDDNYAAALETVPVATV